MGKSPGSRSLTDTSQIQTRAGIVIKNHLHITLQWFTWAIIFNILSGCAGTNPTTINDNTPFQKADISAQDLTDSLKKHNQNLTAVEGKAKAFISQPGNTERLTLQFQSTRDSSLIHIKNRIGIEGGFLFLTPDSVLLFNKVDKFAKKASRSSGAIKELNGIQPVNILTLLNYKVQLDSIADIRQTDDFYQVIENSGTRLLIKRPDFKIQRITEPYKSALPYSNIEFEAFDELDGYSLPRKINILDASGTTNIVLIFQDIEINTMVADFSLEIPNSIAIERL